MEIPVNASAATTSKSVRDWRAQMMNWAELFAPISDLGSFGGREEGRGECGRRDQLPTLQSRCERQPHRLTFA